MSERKLTTAISGSYRKFKPWIDECIDDFTELDVQILEPTKGWLVTLHLSIVQPPFRPLPSERGLDIKEIEDRFLRAVARVDFLYVYSQDGYVGESAAFEVGYAIAREPEVPIYTAEPIAQRLAEGDLEHFHYLKERLVVAGVAEAVQIERAWREQIIQNPPQS